MMKSNGKNATEDCESSIELNQFKTIIYEAGVDEIHLNMHIPCVMADPRNDTLV